MVLILLPVAGNLFYIIYDHLVFITIVSYDHTIVEKSWHHNSKILFVVGKKEHKGVTQ